MIIPCGSVIKGNKMISLKFFSNKNFNNFVPFPQIYLKNKLKI